jgi:thioredoxin-dependent peroxiredoxin
MPQIGEQAPDFELPNQDGEMVRLSDFRGKKVVIFAYPRADTPGCTIQACGFRDEFPRLQTSNAVVFGLSADEPKDQLKWKQKNNLPYDLLCDTDHQVLEQWGAWGEKTNFGKKSMGITRSHWVIDENGVIIDSQIGISPQDSVERAAKAIAG